MFMKPNREQSSKIQTQRSRYSAEAKFRLPVKGLGLDHERSLKANVSSVHVIHFDVFLFLLCDEKCCVGYENRLWNCQDRMKSFV
mmetsp:Transcript_2052/g.4648  ORF Transcript_2052/g.4648 Transcript_2052/m.4648 type:complete len:85 (-) Transcript_2052:48-302(-)